MKAQDVNAALASQGWFDGHGDTLVVDRPIVIPTRAAIAGLSVVGAKGYLGPLVTSGVTDWLTTEASMPRGSFAAYAWLGATAGTLRLSQSVTPGRYILRRLTQLVHDPSDPGTYECGRELVDVVSVQGGRLAMLGAPVVSSLALDERVALHRVAAVDRPCLYDVSLQGEGERLAVFGAVSEPQIAGLTISGEPFTTAKNWSGLTLRACRGGHIAGVSLATLRYGVELVACVGAEVQGVEAEAVAMPVYLGYGAQGCEVAGVVTDGDWCEGSHGMFEEGNTFLDIRCRRFNVGNGTWGGGCSKTALWNVTADDVILSQGAKDTVLEDCHIGKLSIGGGPAVPDSLPEGPRPVTNLKASGCAINRIEDCGPQQAGVFEFEDCQIRANEGEWPILLGNLAPGLTIDHEFNRCEIVSDSSVGGPLQYGGWQPCGTYRLRFAGGSIRNRAGNRTRAICGGAAVIDRQSNATLSGGVEKLGD